MKKNTILKEFKSFLASKDDEESKDDTNASNEDFQVQEIIIFKDEYTHYAKAFDQPSDLLNAKESQ